MPFNLLSHLSFPTPTSPTLPPLVATSFFSTTMSLFVLYASMLYLFLYSRMQKSKRKNFSKIRMKAPLQLLTAVVRLRNSRRDEEKRKAAAYRKETVREIQDP